MCILYFFPTKIIWNASLSICFVVHSSEFKFPSGIQGISQAVFTLTIQICILPAKTYLVYPSLHVHLNCKLLPDPFSRPALFAPPILPRPHPLPVHFVFWFLLPCSIKCCVCSACFSVCTGQLFLFSQQLAQCSVSGMGSQENSVEWICQRIFPSQDSNDPSRPSCPALSHVGFHTMTSQTDVHLGTWSCPPPLLEKSFFDLESSSWLLCPVIVVLPSGAWEKTKNKELPASSSTRQPFMFSKTVIHFPSVFSIFHVEVLRYFNFEEQSA